MTSLQDSPWVIEERRGSAGELHAEPPAPDRRRLVRTIPDEPALVLGSASPDPTDATRVDEASTTVVRRRSGGGAVWVTTPDPLWFDVCIPRQDPLWADDVGVAALWVGEWVARVLVDLGVGGDDGLVVAGARTRPAAGLGRVLCFAGTGPGEVLSAGAKLVGIAQRRSSQGAVFQCAVHRQADSGWVARLADPAVIDVAAATEALDAVAGTGLDPDVVWAALAASLPSA